jgi:hypothetical protein
MYNVLKSDKRDFLLKLSHNPQSIHSMKAVAFFCFLAIVALFCAQTFHTHSGDTFSNSEASCTMCILVHSNSAPLPVLNAVVVAPEPQSVLQADLYDFNIKNQNSSSVQSIRPPPMA